MVDAAAEAPLLSVEGLTVGIRTAAGRFDAVEDVGFTLARGEVLGLVGESGCGKSMTALALMGLLPQPAARITAGRIMFGGDDLVQLPARERRSLRGDRLAMIFQEPMTSLNPVYRIGGQLVEALRAHRGMGSGAAWRRAVEMLELVGIPAAAERAQAYPHELSGGMRQRVMIAMAIICRPDLLIADEPTTALDVSTQAQILDLLLSLRQEIGMAILMITHDLGVIAEVADRVAVMYAGRVVEYADVHSVFRRPRHPYTHALLRSVPRVDVEQERLLAIEGTVASPLDRPAGCTFRDRCPRARQRCAETEPPLAAVAQRHDARCFFPVATDEAAGAQA